MGYRVASDASYLYGQGMSSNFANGELLRYPASGSAGLAVLPSATGGDEGIGTGTPGSGLRGLQAPCALARYIIHN